MRATDPQITWGHRKTFRHLEEVADGLRKDRSKLDLARSITMYHIIVEGCSPSPPSTPSTAG